MLSAPSTAMVVQDYFLMEQIMEAWYDAGKLEATGYAGSTSDDGRDELSHHCRTVNIAENDKITHI